MPKYFVPPEDIDLENGRAHVGGENAGHLKTVLRARPGDVVAICDGHCTDYECEIVGAGKNGLELKILSSSHAREPRLKVKLYQALPKSGKMEYIIQKCVEMGVAEIALVHTANSDVKSLPGAKLARYQKISEAAAKQSMRGLVPPVLPPVELAEAVGGAKNGGLVFAPYENERETSLKTLLSRGAEELGAAAFFIGPEGGFSPKEAETFMGAGIPLVSLGPRVLRTETAGFAVLTILMYARNELGVI